MTILGYTSISILLYFYIQIKCIRILYRYIPSYIMSSDYGQSRSTNGILF